MEPKRWHRVEQLYHSALKVTAERRAIFLSTECRDDEEVRKEVESLLSYETSATEFIESPAFDVAAKLMAENEASEQNTDPAADEAVSSRFRLVEKLGTGGMGVVYKAEDTKLRRLVALKFLPSELSRDPQALARFQREAYAASALNHPNICTIHDIDEYQDQPFIAMELLEGQTLEQRIGAQPLPTLELLDLAMQISDALDTAHKKGIIHRDIKPSNIFITARGQPKILDFGLAKLQESEIADDQQSREEAERTLEFNPNVTLTRTGVAIGTAGYMSPEQIRGEKLDVRTDVFSFGLVLYEMATGQRAFKGDTGPELQNAILEHAPASVRQLNSALPAKVEKIINKALEKNREVRYQTASEMAMDLRLAIEDSRSGFHVNKRASERLKSTKRRWNWVLLGVGAALLIGGLVRGLQTRKTLIVGEKDTIVVSDFVNTTGDPIFDGTLKQALTVKLAESPYFNVLPETALREMLRSMGRSPDERIVPLLARDVCQRTGAKVIVGGGIVALGSGYAIDVDATNCLTGAVVVRQAVQARNREDVLSSLGRVIPRLRQTLGESLSSIRKFDTPIEQATTKSLAALKAYTSGDEQRVRSGDTESVPFYKMAVDLDPDFAVAYARLGAIYSNLANATLAHEYLTKAFEHREHISEREKFYIVAHYYADSTRETDKAVETLSLWTQTYPHDWVAFNNLSAEALKIGQIEQAVRAGQEALQLNPNNPFAYLSLASAYFKASRFVEAKAVCEQAIRAKRDSGDTHAILLNIAFLEGDDPAFERELDVFRSKENLNPGILNQEAWIAFTLGQVRKARGLFERSRAASLHLESANNPLGGKDYAAFSTGTEAQLEVELGNFKEARMKAELALHLMPESAEAQAATALVFARIGNFRRAEQLARKLRERSPASTLLNAVTLPSIRAAAQIKAKNARAAIEQLHSSIPYDLSSHQDFPDGITLYYRGMAYLVLGSGEEAAAQFQKLIDNRGLIAISPYWPLAHLGLARANGLQAHTDKGVDIAARARATAAYRDFLTLWKEADPDIPILKQAKAEYAKLQ